MISAISTDLAVRRKATQIHTVFGPKNFTVIIVDFAAMSVAFLNFFFLSRPPYALQVCPEYMDKHPGEVFRRYLRYRSDPAHDVDHRMCEWMDLVPDCVHRGNRSHCGQILRSPSCIPRQIPRNGILCVPRRSGWLRSCLPHRGDQIRREPSSCYILKISSAVSGVTVSSTHLISTVGVAVDSRRVLKPLPR